MSTKSSSRQIHMCAINIKWHLILGLIGILLDLVTSNKFWKTLSCRLLENWKARKIFSKWNWIKGDIPCRGLIALHLFFMTCFFPQARPSTLMSIFWREPRVSQDSLETPEFLEETDYLDLKETEVKNIDISAIQQKNCTQSVVHSLTFSFKFCKRIFSVFAAQ